MLSSYRNTIKVALPGAKGTAADLLAFGVVIYSIIVKFPLLF